jgi:hypothetical protein
MKHAPTGNQIAPAAGVWDTDKRLSKPCRGAEFDGRKATELA